MISVSDILKVLDKIPEWAGLKQMQGRIAELERRVAALEAAAQTPPPPSPFGLCPKCAARPLVMTAEREHPHFAVFGRKVVSVVCTPCGYTSERDYDPRQRR